MANILIIEDEKDIRNIVTINLTDLNYSVTACGSGEEGLAAVEANDPYDLIILDLMLPGIDGLDVCRQLRSKKNYVPILMLTAKNTEIDRIIGLEMGADDYLSKPFSIRELQARVKAMLRRVEMLSQRDAPSMALTFDDLNIDADKRLVTRADQLIDLTSTEFDLLSFLAQHPGRVFSRTQLLDSVWGYQHAGYEHTVNSHMNRLRRKLEKDPANPEFVLTVWGVGYKFRNNSND